MDGGPDCVKVVAMGIEGGREGYSSQSGVGCIVGISVFVVLVPGCMVALYCQRC